MKRRPLGQALHHGRRGRREAREPAAQVVEADVARAALGRRPHEEVVHLVPRDGDEADAAARPPPLDGAVQAGVRREAPPAGVARVAEVGRPRGRGARASAGRRPRPRRRRSRRRRPARTPPAAGSTAVTAASRRTSTEPPNASTRAAWTSWRAHPRVGPRVVPVGVGRRRGQQGVVRAAQLDRRQLEPEPVDRDAQVREAGHRVGGQDDAGADGAELGGGLEQRDVVAVPQRQRGAQPADPTAHDPDPHPPIFAPDEGRPRRYRVKR